MRFLAITGFMVSVTCTAVSQEERKVHVASLSAFVQKIQMAFGIIDEGEYEKNIEEILKKDPRYIFDDKTSKFTLNLDDKYRKSYALSGYEGSWLKDVRESTLKLDGTLSSEKTISCSEEEIANLEKYIMEVRKMMTLCRSLEWDANGYSYDDLVELIKALSKSLNQLLPESYTKDGRGIKDLAEGLMKLVSYAECKKGASLSIVKEGIFDCNKDPINNLIVMLFMLKSKGIYPEIHKTTILDVTFKFFEHLKDKARTLNEKIESWYESEGWFETFRPGDMPSSALLRNKTIIYNAPYNACILCEPDNFNFIILLAKFISFALPEEFTNVFEDMEESPRLHSIAPCYGICSADSCSGYIYPELIKKVIDARHGDLLADKKDGYLEMFLVYLFNMFILRVIPMNTLENACVTS